MQHASNSLIKEEINLKIIYTRGIYMQNLNSKAKRMYRGVYKHFTVFKNKISKINYLNFL